MYVLLKNQNKQKEWHHATTTLGMRLSQQKKNHIRWK
jgi:hypothetical protein